ncbi:NIMA-related serine/threonine kinase 1 isoform 1 [Hibiscus syriacus]|uniref:NIMA-related serine/threonine kinase 1 isoform 1 n=1 Tax=Hibiscus syriacus TaxID=106335 RepID=A0A6A2YXB5_HIBSY|nr:trihelix transcription factor GTL2-like [Hibiscus syriacus]KAE8684181.1 NIMA-related serine/threonine kinase 1 isoform 1 [Hibiscus syriacus]
MFDGVPVPDQFHQFIGGGASRTTARTAATVTATLLLPLSFTSFDPLFTSSSNSHHHQPPQLLQSLHQQKNNEDDNTSLVAMNMEINERDQRSMAEQIDHHHRQQEQHHYQHQPWSNDEVLALLRVRSSMEPWFPEFTWEHVSRKLAELGLKRSAEKCKEKFEEVNRYFNTMNCSKNYRIFTELDELCQAENPPPQQHHHNHQKAVVAADENNKNAEEEDNIGQNLEGDSRNFDELYQTSPANNNAATSSDPDSKNVVDNKAGNEDDNEKNSNNKKKRKRVKKLEIFKGFCEEIVNKLMIQQEEMYNKLLEDMVKRDKEKVAREEAWNKQELDMINQELELRAKEQAIAGDRQATIIKLLTKFSQNECSNLPLAASSSSLPVAENPNPISNDNNKVDQISITTSESQNNQNANPKTPTPQNPNSPLTPLKVTKAPQNPTSNDKEDLGKRWPRDEVSALINLRCSLYNNGNHHDKEGAAIKAPLWERISQGMLDLGYKRSAKRCKEKWENVNKYFRKTKDVNKKRSLDSRTCPYFHQLSTLYNQGTLTSPSK